mgnify:CR=1 FL=1
MGDWGTITSKRRYGSTETKKDIPFQCYEIKTAEVFITYSKDKLSGVTQILCVGKTKTYCECLAKTESGWITTDGQTNFADLHNFPTGEINNPGQVVKSSPESGSYSWFMSTVKECCEPCAVLYFDPSYPPEGNLVRNPNCMCYTTPRNPAEVPVRISQPSQGWDQDSLIIQREIKKALDKLGGCMDCNPVRAYPRRYGPVV